MTSSMLASAGVALAQGWAMSTIVAGGGGEPVGGGVAGGEDEPYPPPPPPPHAQSRLARRARSTRLGTRRPVMAAVYGCSMRDSERTEAYSAGRSARLRRRSGSTSP